MPSSWIIKCQKLLIVKVLSSMLASQCEGMQEGANALERCPWRTVGAGVVDHADGGGRKEALRSIRPRSPVSRFLPRLEGPRLALWGHLAEERERWAAAARAPCQIVAAPAGALNPCALSSHKFFAREGNLIASCLLCVPRELLPRKLIQ